MVGKRVPVTAACAFILAFLFLVPVVSYAFPPGVYNCPPNGCDFVHYGSVTYWGLGVGGVWTDANSYSISVTPASAVTISSSSVSYTISSLCIGPTSVGTTSNGTSTTTQTCSTSQLVLDAQGCYDYSSGAIFCVRGAPPDSLADLYSNGTITVTYPSGHKVTCQSGSETGPCSFGIP